MNILITNYDDQPQFVGGIKRVCSILAQEWRKMGHNVFFLGICNNPYKFHEIDGTLQVFVPDEKQIDSEENVSFCEELIKTQQFDILLNPFCDSIEIVNLCKACRENTGIKVVSALHFSINHLYDTARCNFFIAWKMNSFSAWLRECLLYLKFHLVSKSRIIENNKKHLKQIAENSDHFVVLSQNFLPIVKQITTIPQISSLNNPSYPPEITAVSKENYVLWCGRVEYGTKRTDRVLKIWKRIQDKFPDWKLVVMGSGANDYFSELANKYNIRNVIFTGFCSTPKEWYKKASIVCTTSNTEGWGMTLIEGAGYGCVPIAYNSYASVTDLIVDGENGFKVKAFNQNEFVKKLSLLMSNEELREKMSKKAQEHVLRFSPEKIAAQWIDLFNELLKK